jgi:hypothetical protein
MWLELEQIYEATLLCLPKTHWSRENWERMGPVSDLLASRMQCQLASAGSTGGPDTDLSLLHYS